jgi:hypothetical protein
MHYSEEEIAAEEEKLGAKLPDVLRMTQETQEVREMMGEFFPDEILVAWGADGTGDLVVVLKDGSLRWWRHDQPDAELVAIDIDWSGA